MLLQIFNEAFWRAFFRPINEILITPHISPQPSQTIQEIPTKIWEII